MAEKKEMLVASNGCKAYFEEKTDYSNEALWLDGRWPLDEFNDLTEFVNEHLGPLSQLPEGCIIKFDGDSTKLTEEDVIRLAREQGLLAMPSGDDSVKLSELEASDETQTDG